MNEYGQGAKDCRDNIISRIIGMQNDIGCDEKSQKYQALQELLLVIERDYGEFMKPYKG